MDSLLGIATLDWPEFFYTWQRHITQKDLDIFTLLMHQWYSVAYGMQ